MLASDSVDFQVAAPDLEHDNPKANLALLRRIAALTGGRYYDPEQAGEAFQALAKRQAGDHAALRAYQEMILRGLRLTKPGGLAVPSSCSGRVSRAQGPLPRPRITRRAPGLAPNQVRMSLPAGLAGVAALPSLLGDMAAGGGERV